MRLFDGFVLHRGSPRPETGEGTKVAYWLAPVLGQHQMGGYVDRLREKTVSAGSGFPIGEAESNSSFSAGSLGQSSKHDVCWRRIADLHAKRFGKPPAS